ncbi:MAG: thiamine phosphate synthase [Archaeoglobaceae archaeon]
MLEKLRVYFITDPRYGKHEELAEAALKAGIRAIQLRDKNASGRELYETAKRLRKLTYDYDALLIINDRLDVAMLSEADGVHLGSEDLPYDVARRHFDGIIGVTVRSVEEAVRAERFADYLGAGSVFASRTKEAEVIGLEGLREIVASVSVPVVAIGGIDESNAAEVFRAGAFGIAVVSAIAASHDPCRAAKRLLEVANFT